jgi:hypothetical protein
MGMAADTSQIAIPTSMARAATPNTVIRTPRPETAGDAIQEMGITAEMLILAAITDASKPEVITMAIQAAMAIMEDTAMKVMAIKTPMGMDIRIPTDATDIIAETIIIRLIIPLITPAMNINQDIMTISIIQTIA